MDGEGGLVVVEARGLEGERGRVEEQRGVELEADMLEEEARGVSG